MFLMGKDTYITIETPAEGFFKDRNSKFFAFAFPVSSEHEIKEHLEAVKKKYHDARHHCYAYALGQNNGVNRANDDGEPSGTAGKPIYGQILSAGLHDILIIVVRYFGGTLLGTGGLINAYRNAAANAIAHSKVKQVLICKPLSIRFGYSLMNPVMRFIEDEKIEMLEKEFSDTCYLKLNIQESKYSSTVQRLSNLYGLEIDQ